MQGHWVEGGESSSAVQEHAGSPGHHGLLGLCVAEGACCCQRQKTRKRWGFPAFPGGNNPSGAPLLLRRFKLKYEICIRSPQGLAQ